MRPRIIAISLCALFCWAAFSAAGAPGHAAGAGADWRLEFYTDLNIPTGTPFGSIGSLNRTNTAALAGRPAVQLPKSELLKRKLGGGFGGISGLTFDPASGTLYALPDSASPMLFTLKAAIEGRELHLAPLDAIGLTNSDGERIAPWVLDPEGIALTPWGSLIASSEGYTGRTPPVDPALVEFSTGGKLLRYLPVPDKFLRKGGERQTSGVRHNLGFESLSISPDGRRMFTANEGPLVQDGERCGVDRGCLIRIVEYEVKGHVFTPLHEYGYSVDAMPLPEDLRGASGAMGVSDILAVSDSDLLVLERGFASVGETGKNLLRTHLYRVRLAGAKDVSRVPSLADAKAELVRKTLMLDLGEITHEFTPGYQRLDNFEGITFGPALPDGGKSIVLASDNNFQEAQRTAFVVLRLIGR